MALPIIPYDRKAAVRYAHQGAFSRNPAFYDYEELGGDCTNFASQCVFAGAGVMNFTPTYGWFYRGPDDRTPSWTGVPFFYDFLTANRGAAMRGACGQKQHSCIPSWPKTQIHLFLATGAFRIVPKCVLHEYL